MRLGRSAGMLSQRVRATVCSTTATIGNAPTPPPEPAPPPAPRVTSEAQIAPRRWDVERVRCSDLLGAADEDREAVAMFYYGYLAAKAGIRLIDVNQIDGNVRKVMDRCVAAPNITVPQAFRQALGCADDPQTSAAFRRRQPNADSIRDELDRAS
jgi:hypothetical protein